MDAEVNRQIKQIITLSSNQDDCISRMQKFVNDLLIMRTQKLVNVDQRVKPEIAEIIKMLDKMIEQIETTSTVRPVIKGIELTLVKLIKMNIEKQFSV